MTDQPKAPARQPISPARAFAAAVALHSAGRLSEAGQSYRRILEFEPGHFGATHYLGIVCTQQGRLDEALVLLRSAVAQNPQSFEAYTNLGIALAAARRLDAAVVEYQTAIALKPDFVEARNNLGAALIGLGRHADAAAQFQRALALKPDLAALHNNLGSALAGCGRHGDAVPAYREALRLNPQFAEACNNLGLSLVALGKANEAIEVYRTALSLLPGYTDVHANLAVTLAALRSHEAALPHFQAALAGRPDSAETCINFGNSLAALNRQHEAVPQYLKALELRPEFAEAHNNLGNALVALQRGAEAAGHYRKALALRPDYADAHNNLGSLLAALGSPADALAHYRQAIAIQPGLANAHGNLGSALAALDRNEEALAAYRRALALDPALAEAHAGIGAVYETLGQLQTARQELELAVALAPQRAQFHRSLAAVKRFAAGDPQLATMETLDRSAALAAEERIHLHFAMAKAYDDLGEPARAFHHLVKGNAGRRAEVDYNEAATLRAMERTAAIFTPELMQRHAGQGDASPVPVFIVGMPRSGSTLIEQILASHSGVFGAGEINAFSAAVTGLAPAGGNLPGPFPEAVADMTAAQLHQIGSQYVDGLRVRAPTAARITDKTLGDFLLAGLIHLALPNARIIHARRDPVDSCLSSFSKLFAGAMAFTYDLAELGRYYRAYDVLMAHWRRVLPAGVMLEVGYEDLVADFEPQARRILAHCGLQWEEQCMRFHLTQRPVKTASATQVREPIYRSSIGRWRPFKAMLGPLLDELGIEESGVEELGIGE
jgi:tetratricopeptide (TPR) repeat protein